MCGIYNCYSLSKNGNQFISPHFQVKEFKIPGKDEVRVALELIDKLEALSDCINNKAIYIEEAFHSGDKASIRAKNYIADDLAVLAHACGFPFISKINKTTITVSIDTSIVTDTFSGCDWIHVRKISFDAIDHIELMQTRESVKTTSTKFDEYDYVLNAGFFGTYKDPVFNLKIHGRTISASKDRKWGMIFTKDRIRYGELSSGNTFISGYPILLDNGKFCAYEYASEIDYETQRTAIGYDDNHLYLLVCDKDRGLTLRGLRQVMKYIGCKSAINLDGGGSSALYQKGKVINKQTDHRKVNSCILIKLKDPS